MDLSLAVSGAGSLDAGTYGKGGPLWKRHANLFPFSVTDDGDISNGLDQIYGVASYILGPSDLMWDLFITASDGCQINLDLAGDGAYWPYAILPWPPIPIQPGDLGDLTLYVALTGDMDNDRVIDFNDFANFAEQWRKTGCGQCDGADFTGDGNVDENDLGEFAENWLGGCF
ncbi:MAG: hypothetical protein ACYS8Y_01965 [Planctomycetota bacterium]|jgi:hypothetical protein